MNKKHVWLARLCALLFWLGVWELAARMIDLPFAIPTVGATFAALLRLVVTVRFWLTIAMSLGRVLLGLALGTIIAVMLAALSVHHPFADAIISPMMRVIRCTPVASFILMLWVLVGRDTVPQAVALLMVMPVMWETLRGAWQQLDPQLNEVLTVFRVSRLRRIKLLVIPGLLPSFRTALATAAGLAWKAGVAAEVIAYTSCAIGREIADARSMFNGAEMMAWTLCVVALSLPLERLIAVSVRAEKKEREQHGA